MLVQALVQALAQALAQALVLGRALLQALVQALAQALVLAVDHVIVYGSNASIVCERWSPSSFSFALTPDPLSGGS